MKIITAYLLTLCFSFFILACQNQSAQSQQTENSTQNINSEILNVNVSEQISETDVKDDLNIVDLVSEKEFLDYKGFRISQFITQKKYDKDAPIADIADAVLKKKGREIIKFDGAYYPLGNQMQFGLFSLLKNQNKELLVYDNTNKFGRFWVVNFENDAKLIFDSGDWGGFREWVSFTDVEDDGIYEVSMARYNTLDFELLASIETPLMSIIFKYDKKANRYLPANHKYQDSARTLIGEQNTKENLEFRNVMENFLQYLYAGMETQAWEYFEKNYIFLENSSGFITKDGSNFNGVKNDIYSAQKSKELAKERIKKSLAKDTIYQFIKSDMENNK